MLRLLRWSTRRIPPQFLEIILNNAPLPTYLKKKIAKNYLAACVKSELRQYYEFIWSFRLPEKNGVKK